MTENIESHIFIVRGEKVMLDSDLAELYGVTTKRLNEQVKRNRQRFPSEFMFQLHRAENAEVNRSQIATGSQKHRDPRFLPYVFTEHGAVMLATVLNSPIAIQASIQIVKAFVRMRTILAAHKELAKKLEALEKSTLTQKKATDANFAVVFKFIKDYLQSKKNLPSAIGFKVGRKK